MAHPHLRQRKTIRQVYDPALGQFEIPGFPVKFSDWAPPDDLKASRVGQDNEAVLGELLGLSTREIEALYAEGVLLKAQPAAPEVVS